MLSHLSKNLLSARGTQPFTLPQPLLPFPSAALLPHRRCHTTTVSPLSCHIRTLCLPFCRYLHCPSLHPPLHWCCHVITAAPCLPFPSGTAIRVALLSISAASMLPRHLLISVPILAAPIAPVIITAVSLRSLNLHSTTVSAPRVHRADTATATLREVYTGNSVVNNYRTYY